MVCHYTECHLKFVLFFLFTGMPLVKVKWIYRIFRGTDVAVQVEDNHTLLDLREQLHLRLDPPLVRYRLTLTQPNRRNMEQ